MKTSENKTQLCDGPICCGMCKTVTDTYLLGTIYFFRSKTATGRPRDAGSMKGQTVLCAQCIEKLGKNIKAKYTNEPVEEDSENWSTATDES